MWCDNISAIKSVDIQAQDPVWYNQLTNNLNEEQKQELQHLFVLADQRRAAQGKKLCITGYLGSQFIKHNYPRQFMGLWQCNCQSKYVLPLRSLV